MKDIKELWIQYQTEKELQVIEVPTTSHNDERIRELEKTIFNQKNLDETPRIPASSTPKIRA